MPMVPAGFDPYRSMLVASVQILAGMAQDVLNSICKRIYPKELQLAAVHVRDALHQKEWNHNPRYSIIRNCISPSPFRFIVYRSLHSGSLTRDPE